LPEYTVSKNVERKHGQDSGKRWITKGRNHMICPHCHRSIAAKPHDPITYANLVLLAETAKKYSISVAASKANCTVAALYSRLNRAGIRLKGKK
jgi:hypothetical protein